MKHRIKIGFQFNVSQLTESRHNDCAGGIRDDDLRLGAKLVGAFGAVTRGVIDVVADELHSRAKLLFEPVNDRPRSLALFSPVGIELDQRRLASLQNGLGGRRSGLCVDFARQQHGCRCRQGPLKDASP